MNNSKKNFIFASAIPFVTIALVFVFVFAIKNIFVPRYKLLYMVSSSQQCLDEAFSIKNGYLVADDDFMSVDGKAGCDNASRTKFFVYGIYSDPVEQISLQDLESLKIKGSEQSPDGLSYSISYRYDSSRATTSSVISLRDRSWKKSYSKSNFIRKDQGYLKILGWVKINR